MILDKAKMAHDWVIKYGKVDSNYNRENTVQLAWDYADAMQAEADKRNNKETCDKNIGLDSSVLKPSLLKDEISGFFINIETNDVIYSESDIISHDWRRIPDNVDFVALRLIDSKMFFCVASEVDEGKFKVIWKRPQ